ncbi:MAG: hypothetical protein ACK52I_18155 [Pseudomonadota bacterium]
MGTFFLAAIGTPALVRDRSRSGPLQYRTDDRPAPGKRPGDRHGRPRFAAQSAVGARRDYSPASAVAFTVPNR